MLVLLHDIRSMHNVGSIFRTADAAGVEKIYLCGITPEPVDVFGRPRPQITKVSLGAEKSVAWEHCDSTLKLISKLKKDGYKIFAIEQSKNSIPYYKIRSTCLPAGRFGYNSQFRIALVLGNEIKGIPSVVLKKCDKILEIPMRGKKESLNVAISFGIVAFSIIHNS